MSSRAIQKALGFPQKVDLDAQLKAMLANSFWSDANDFLWRVDILSDTDFQHRSFRGKIFVDYRMAAECAFKSAIIRLSKADETPQDSYNIARKPGHLLPKLMSEAKLRAAKRVRFISAESEEFFTNLSLGVSARYDIDLLFLHFNTKSGYSSALRDSINKSAFMKDLRTSAYDVFEFAGRCRERSRNKSHVTKPKDHVKVQEAFKKLRLR